MEQKLVIGGQALEDKEKDKAKEIRMYQLELEKQKQVEQKLFEENKKKEEEVLMVEHQYKSIKSLLFILLLDLQDEVDENRKIIKQLRNRYKGALQEIED